MFVEDRSIGQSKANHPKIHQQSTELSIALVFMSLKLRLVARL